MTMLKKSTVKPKKTTIEIRYPADRGGLSIRGDVEPLSWTRSTPPTRVVENRHIFELESAPTLIEFKAFRDDGLYSAGRDFAVQSGQSIVVEPYFESSTGILEGIRRSLWSAELGRNISYEVFLPPSYRELPDRRYPVLYAQDGQSVFSTNIDPIDGASMCMDHALNELYDLAAIEEILVVAIRTDEKRLEMLSPMPDPHHGGGEGPRYLSFLIDSLKPTIDTTYRTRPGRVDTGLIGASMGGLFSFFAAWRTPDVFGKATCLSSSFWWNDRFMVREVESGGCPLPRPIFYLDSGAAKTAYEQDANLRDGYHHTLAMRQALVTHGYVSGQNVYGLAFAGMSHNNASWAGRLAVPLQLMFPLKPPVASEVAPERPLDFNSSRA